MPAEQIFTRKPLRWIFAALFVIVATGLALYAIIRQSAPEHGFYANAAFTVVVFCALVLFAMPLVREPKSPDRVAKELEAKGLLQSNSYRAHRAFRVEQPDGRFEHFGPHYYIELQDGKVLHLNGDYLVFYEPETWLAQGRPRRFPCTEFTIRRHKWDESLIDIVCGGEVLEPEVNAPPFQEWEADQVPGDEEVIENKTYSELKAERMKSTGMEFPL